MTKRKREKRKVVADGPGCYVVPFGRYRGETLDAVCSTDEGLQWLDWAVDNFRQTNVVDALRRYADQPDVQKEIARATS